MKALYSANRIILSLYSAIIEVLRPSDDSFVNPPMMKTLFSVDVVANIEILGYKSRLKMTIFYYLLFARIKWVISNDIALQHNRVFRFSCSLDYKSPLQMALLYTHPKHWHINVENLTMTPP